MFKLNLIRKWDDGISENLGFGQDSQDLGIPDQHRFIGYYLNSGSSGHEMGTIEGIIWSMDHWSSGMF